MITAKRKIEEQCESAQKNTLKWTDLHYAMLLANGSLNNVLTLTMQNIDVTEAPTAQLRADKKELKTKSQQKYEEKQIGFDPE